MSLYNILHGMNATLVVALAPFLPQHPETFPRFRDIDFWKEEDGTYRIGVLTRMGGGNMQCQNEPEVVEVAHTTDGAVVERVVACRCNACRTTLLRESPHFVEFLDNGDYATLVFQPDAEHQADLQKLVDGVRMPDWYTTRLRELFPPDAQKPKTTALVTFFCEGRR